MYQSRFNGTQGSKVEFCAGKIAEIFKDIGGEVIYFGKPHKEIYNICLDMKKKFNYW